MFFFYYHFFEIFPMKSGYLGLNDEYLSLFMSLMSFFFTF